MNREALLCYVREQYGITEEYPWTDENAVLRHNGSKKWFGIVMRIPRNRLGLEGDTPIDILNVKCDPFLVGSLITKEGYHRAYHMNKEKWITLRLDGSIPKDEILTLLDLSYAAVSPKIRPKKVLIPTDNPL